jgi:hypothetical protein
MKHQLLHVKYVICAFSMIPTTNWDYLPAQTLSAGLRNEYAVCILRSSN